MIHLTRLNNSAMVLNAELIKFIESAPDTVITLVSGEKIIVRESTDDVIERVIEFRRRINQAGVPLARYDACCSDDMAASEAEQDS